MFGWEKYVSLVKDIGFGGCFIFLIVFSYNIFAMNSPFTNFAVYSIKVILSIIGYVLLDDDISGM